ncbi:MAG TPA: PQQ-dependent sugar dehydrogenase, partial [Kiritimatiellia bacterium]
MNGAARIFSVLLAMTAAAFAQPIPDIQLVPVASGFRAPVHATGSRDGSGRLFVVEQAGRIRVVDRTAPIRHGVFLSITDHVTAGGEMGLLSVAFHPDFRNNRKLFVNYTTSLDKKLYTQVSQFIA